MTRAVRRGGERRRDTASGLQCASSLLYGGRGVVGGVGVQPYAYRLWLERRGRVAVLSGACGGAARRELLGSGRAPLRAGCLCNRYH